VVPEDVDDLIKITSRHFRQAEQLCRRRLASECRSRYGNWGSTARFEVANRIVGDARLAHTDFGPPERKAFVVPRELATEQQRVYETAVAGYLTLFGAEPARSIDLGFDTVLDDPPARLVGDIGLALETDTGCVVRVLRIGERGYGQRLLDDTDLRFTLLRAASWVDGQETLDVVVAELLNLGTETFTIDVGAELGPTREWARERVEAIEVLVADDRPEPGHDCLGCKFVAGCTAHRDG
jgi:hypothetical protein